MAEKITPKNEKPADEKNLPFEFKNPFTSSDEDDKPEPKAKSAPDAPEKPAAKAPASKKSDDADNEPPAAPRRTIEELLADPTFDPDGRYRSKLAEISSREGMGKYPPADMLDDHGQPVG